MRELSTSSPARDGVHAAAGSSDVARPIGDLDALVTFLQAEFEQKSSQVARKLHDEIGGAVIGAMMDVAWVEQHDIQLTPDTTMRLARIKDGLRGAIDLARTMVEELRPTLLDSVGLFAALSWQFRRGCKNAGIEYRETYPQSAPEMEPDRLIGLFRIAQEAFNLSLQQESVSLVSLSVETSDDTLMVRMADDRKHFPTDSVPPSAALLSIFHRAKHLNGEAEITSSADGGAVFRVAIPLN